MSSLLMPCICGHGMGSHSILVGHCCATAGEGPRRVTGACGCKRYEPVADHATTPAPIAGKAEMPEPTPPGVVAYEQFLAAAHVTRADEMPNWVRNEVKDAREIVGRKCGLPLFVERASIWLADDRERLLAENAAFRQREMDQENAEASVCPEDIGFVEYIGSLKSALDRAQRERDALSQSHDELFAERTALRDALFMFASVLQASGRWSPKLATAMAEATKPLHDRRASLPSTETKP